MALEAVEAMASGKAEFVLGTYTGTGAGTKTVNVGFRPKAILLCYATYNTIEIQGAEHPLVTLTASGFNASHSNTYGSTPNMEGAKYAYLAFR